MALAIIHDMQFRPANFIHYLIGYYNNLAYNQGIYPYYLSYMFFFPNFTPAVVKWLEYRLGYVTHLGVRFLLGTYYDLKIGHYVADSPGAHHTISVLMLVDPVTSYCD